MGDERSGASDWECRAFFRCGSTHQPITPENTGGGTYPSSLFSFSDPCFLSAAILPIPSAHVIRLVKGGVRGYNGA